MPISPPALTLFVDSSFHPKIRVGGWGAWAKYDGWEKGYTAGGPIPSTYDLRNSTDAELAGITMALQRLAANPPGPLDHIVLQCDSLIALQLIVGALLGRSASRAHNTDAHVRSGYQAKSDLERLCLREIKEATASLQINCRPPLWVRHVKGHLAGTTSRSWVNEKCDEIAKYYMRRELKNA